MKIKMLVSDGRINKAADFAFDGMGGCTPFVGGRGEHIQAGQMREVEAHCFDPLKELGLYLYLLW
jgi:hypothetical protein